MPLFDEPMMLAIYEDHPWANRDRVPMSDLAGEKLLMLEDGHCLRDQAMGFCFEAGRMRIPTSARPAGNAAQYGGGRQRHYPAAGAGGAAGENAMA